MKINKSLKYPVLMFQRAIVLKRVASMSINYGTFNFQPLNSIEGNPRSCSPRMALLSPAEPQRKSLGAQLVTPNPRSSASFNPSTYASSDAYVCVGFVFFLTGAAPLPRNSSGSTAFFYLTRNPAE